MASKQAFLPVATEETNEYVVPMYSPDGPDQGSRQDFAVASGSAVASPPAPGGARRNHLYCNFCCDCRRAVLAINAFSMIYALGAIIYENVVVFKKLEEIGKDQKDYEDDTVIYQQIDATQLKFVELLVDAFSFISIAMHACGMYGALKFKKWGIAVGGSAYAIGFAISLIRFDIVDLILAAALGYPHYFLIKEINAGIMTDYNYHNVAYCCGRA